MVLIILEVSSLACDISPMEVVSSDMESLALTTAWPASFIRLSACWALSAFCLVMDDISSREEEVSSIAEACSAAPSARDWLADETSPDAQAT